MQQLLQLKEEPQDTILTENLFDLNPMKEGFGGLRDLMSTLFTSSFLLELKEETRSLDITLDEEEKKLILKLKKKTKSKSLAKRGRVYALREELKMVSLTLVYDYQTDYGVLNELQPIMPIEPMMDVVKPVEVTQPKTMISDIPKLMVKPPILIDNPDNITIVLPLTDYTEKLLQELPEVAYEDKFKPIAKNEIYSELEVIPDNSQLGPEKIIRPEDLVQQYKPNLVVQTQTQNFEGQMGVVHNIYENPIRRDGELFHEEYRFTSNRWTTAYQAMLDAGLRISSRHSSRFRGEYIVAVNGSGERDGTYWEIKVNGHYIPVTADKFMVPPGAEVTLVRKTARSSVCGEPVAG